MEELGQSLDKIVGEGSPAVENIARDPPVGKHSSRYQIGLPRAPLGHHHTKLLNRRQWLDWRLIRLPRSQEIHENAEERVFSRCERQLVDEVLDGGSNSFGFGFGPDRTRQFPPATPDSQQLSLSCLQAPLSYSE
jgi:hypothetical protein